MYDLVAVIWLWRNGSSPHYTLSLRQRLTSGKLSVKWNHYDDRGKGTRDQPIPEVRFDDWRPDIAPLPEDYGKAVGLVFYEARHPQLIQAIRAASPTRDMTMTLEAIRMILAPPRISRSNTVAMPVPLPSSDASSTDTASGGVKRGRREFENPSCEISANAMMHTLQQTVGRIIPWALESTDSYTLPETFTALVSLSCQSIKGPVMLERAQLSSGCSNWSRRHVVPADVVFDVFSALFGHKWNDARKIEESATYLANIDAKVVTLLALAEETPLREESANSTRALVLIDNTLDLWHCYPRTPVSHRSALASYVASYVDCVQAAWKRQTHGGQRGFPAEAQTVEFPPTASTTSVDPVSIRVSYHAHSIPREVCDTEKTDKIEVALAEVSDVSRSTGNQPGLDESATSTNGVASSGSGTGIVTGLGDPVGQVGC
jgi:hypothetical protein